MILNKIREKVNSYVGKRCRFIYHGSRNQKDDFYGVIVNLFPVVFLVRCSDGSIKSYSYNDVLISTLEIIP